MRRPRSAGRKQSRCSGGRPRRAGKAGCSPLFPLFLVLLSFPLFSPSSTPFSARIAIPGFPPPCRPLTPSSFTTSKVSRPALGTVAIYGFLSTYNQYFWPLLITNETLMRTTQVGIAQLRFEESLRWGLVMAGVIMVAVPTLALLVLGQRQLIRGLTAGAGKGYTEWRG